MFQNHVLLAKSDHLVYKITNYVLNRDQFLLMFLNMIHEYEKFQKNICILVSFYRHKNIISRHVHTNVTQYTVVKTPTFIKFNKNQVKYIFIYFFKPVLNVCYFNYMLFNQIHTHSFNISVICCELRFLENIKGSRMQIFCI